MVFRSLIILATVICQGKLEAVLNAHYTACAMGNNTGREGNTCCAERQQSPCPLLSPQLCSVPTAGTGSLAMAVL